MCFVSASGYITQIRRPLTTYVFQTAWRNIIVMGHNFIVFIVVAAIYLIVPKATIFLLFLSLPLVVLNVLWMALLLAVVSARFRDIPVMLQSMFMILFWLTPIIYYPEQLGSRRIIVDLNPFSHMMELLRAPLLGQSPSLTSWFVVCIMAVLGWVVTVLIFARFRARIAYWL